MSDLVHPDSVLLVTLDSCRHDTAAETPTPTLDTIGPMHRAMAPGHFTLASHAAIWVGTTPGIPGLRQPVLDPKSGRLFRLEAKGIRARAGDVFVLDGATIIEGFKSAGYLTLGTGAVDWFDPDTPAGARLIQDFEHFLFVRGAGLPRQVDWLLGHLPASRPVFAFVNVGETHVPYWYEGAPWDPESNPCHPHAGDTNDREQCVARQSACLRYADTQLRTVVHRFRAATIMVTADHGDAWGEDGLWEHGTWHPVVMTVPLWVRVKGRPCTRQS
ncbi:MAG: hypothetical protein O7H41_00665 [Planctomycetota bacterium]|nr:hypothetical protein [Planctomycetota bacterium]